MTQHVGTKTRIHSPETRQRILDVTRSMLERRGTVLAVSAITNRAGVQRTVFYRHFDNTSQAIVAVLDQLAERQSAGAGAWFADVGPTGTRDVVHANALSAARAFAANAQLMSAIADAATHDDDLRSMWHQRVVQPRIDATAAAIRRDQAAGAIRAALDPDDTALALQTMGITIALQILGREGGEPERVADIIAPIWQAVLFGPS